MEEFMIRCFVSLDEDNEDYTYDYLDIDLNEVDDGIVVAMPVEIKLQDDEGYIFEQPQEKVRSKHKCKECGKEYNQKQQLIEHIKNFHVVEEVINSTQYSCPYCSYKCKTTNSLISHLLSHNGRPGRKRNFRCSSFGCGYSCRTVAELKSHTHKCQKRK